MNQAESQAPLLGFFPPLKGPERAGQMELLNSWIDRIPVDRDPAEITKAEILSTAHCYLSAYFSRLCGDLHGRTLKILFEYDWPDKTPGPLNVYPSRIQTGLEWLFTLLDPLSKYVYLNRVNQAYPKKAPLHKIRESLLRDQKSGFKVFKRFEKDLQSFWREHLKPLNPGRDWRENEKLAEGAFFDLIQTKPGNLAGKLGLAFMAAKLATFTGNSQLSGQKLDVFSRFLQDFCKNLQIEYAEALFEIGGRAVKSKGGSKQQDHRLLLEEVLLKIRSDRKQAGKTYGGQAVFDFFQRETLSTKGGKKRNDRHNPLRFKTASGAVVCVWYDGSDPDNEKIFYYIEVDSVQQQNPIPLKAGSFIKLPGVFEKLSKKTTPRKKLPLVL